MEKAIFAAGCFWGVEEAFRGLRGVEKTRVGYTGGTMENPTYRDVCADLTGHAEAVEVTFNPEIISYGDLLRTFWKIHDPTTPDRQGPDTGSQYRSAVFYLNPEQRLEAENSRKKWQDEKYPDRRIVTEIAPAGPFWEAEEYHQQYILKRGGSGGCHST